MGIEYKKATPVDCDLCEAALEQAVIKIGPAFIYNLHVAADGRQYAQRLLTQLRMDYKENPFSPYFNLVVDYEFKWDEWCLEANSLAFGSKGA